MKLIMLSLSFFVLIFSSASYISKQNPNQSTAIVQQHNGIDVYHYSTPTRKYDIVGRHSISIVWTGSPEERMNIAYKQLIKKAPTSDGIIFSEGMGNITFIKYID